MGLLLTADVNSRLPNFSFKVLFLDNYTLLPLVVQFLEVPLEIIVWNALWGSCCCISHLIRTTETLSIQLIFHNPEEVKVSWQEIWRVWRVC